MLPSPNLEVVVTRRILAESLELDDDPSRVDLDAVYEFLSKQSYWARDRTRDEVATTLKTAARVVGLYDAKRLVGFARVVSDSVHIAYLADVYVLPAYRGRGLGVELVRETVDGGPLSRLRWWLSTGGAHELYRRFRFDAPDEAFMTRPGQRSTSPAAQ
jgi:ribosomal protein S18 acetylase RimI-like enzyme